MANKNPPVFAGGFLNLDSRYIGRHIILRTIIKSLPACAADAAQTRPTPIRKKAMVNKQVSRSMFGKLSKRHEGATMHMNADFSQRAIVRFEASEWVASPMPGVRRRMLDRIGAEVARATSIVRFEPGSALVTAAALLSST